MEWVGFFLIVAFSAPASSGKLFSLGVEVMYDLYNPTILKIETLKLERRLDDDLSYLIDALPEYRYYPLFC
jgi:hypothetical protein